MAIRGALAASCCRCVLTTSQTAAIALDVMERGTMVGKRRSVNDVLKLGYISTSTDPTKVTESNETLSYAMRRHHTGLRNSVSTILVQ